MRKFTLLTKRLDLIKEIKKNLEILCRFPSALDKEWNQEGIQGWTEFKIKYPVSSYDIMKTLILLNDLILSLLNEEKILNE